MIDLHSHVLAGIDDGAHDLEQAVQIVCSMWEDGVQIVVATPHVRDDFPTTPAQMEAALAELRAAIAARGIEIDVRPGGEIALDRLPQLEAAERARFGLGGNPAALLLEFPYHGWPRGLERACALLRRDGIVPVVAHPERNPDVQERPEEMRAIVATGAVVQLTAGSVDGRLGRSPARCAQQLLDLGLAHIIASDAHAPGVREAGLSAAVAVVGDDLGRWLTYDVPAAVLEGRELPARPAGRRRVGILRRLRR